MYYTVSGGQKRKNVTAHGNRPFDSRVPMGGAEGPAGLSK